jgi:hypothetical protein
VPKLITQKSEPLSTAPDSLSKLKLEQLAWDSEDMDDIDELTVKDEGDLQKNQDMCHLNPCRSANRTPKHNSVKESEASSPKADEDSLEAKTAISELE